MVMIFKHITNKDFLWICLNMLRKVHSRVVHVRNNVVAYSEFACLSYIFNYDYVCYTFL